MAAPSSAGPTAAIRFGVYELDTEAGELRRGGIRVRVEGQPLKVLRLLVSRAGELVTRDDLREELAPGAQFGDVDHVVNVAVAKLRTALGDSAGVPRFIETVPRRGYKFIYPITLEAPAPPQQPIGPSSFPAVLPAPGDARRPPYLRRVVGIVAVVVIVLVALSSRRTKVETAPPLPSARVETSLPGIEFMPAISPDGKFLSFLWIVPERPFPDLYVKMIGGEKLVRLTQDGAGSSAWSPDSTQVAAIVCHASQSCDLELFPALGGAPRVLLPIRFQLARAEKTRLSFSPDGRHIAVPQPEGEGAYRILEIDTVSAASRGLTQPVPATSGDFSPAYSPDGKRLAYLRANDGEFNVVVQDVSGGAPVILTTKAISADALDWTPDGTRVVVASERRLWLLDSRAPGPLRPVAFNSEGATIFSTSASGKLVYARFDPLNTNIWRVPLAGSGQPRIAIESSRIQTKPDISPNGREVVFVSDRTGSRQLWKCSAAGMDCLQLSESASAGSEPGSPRWSPDGTSIAYTAHAGGHSRIFLMDGNGHNARPITSASGDDVAPAWSPDGEWVYFGSNRSGRWQIWKTRASGAAVQVTSNGGYIAGVTADGTLVHSRSDTDPDLWVQKRDGSEERVAHRAQVTPADAWAIWKDRVYLYDATDRSTPELRELDLRTQATRTVARINVARAGVQGTRPAIAPDGSYALIPITAPNQCDLVLVEPFR